MTNEADFQVSVDAGCRVEIVRRDRFRTSRWRNGGGVTHEAVRRPANGERFDWRVSVAEIGASGPFSAFDGYRRHMLLLRGAGLELRFADGRLEGLAHGGDLVAFAGAPPPDCRLTAGACVDLNLISAAGIPVETWVLRDARPLDVAVERGNVVLAFGIDATGSVEVPSASPGRIEPSDLAIVDVVSAGRIGARALACPPAGVLFLAKLAPSEGGMG
jgi:environmental stress-induced protein Ves